MNRHVLFASLVLVGCSEPDPECPPGYGQTSDGLCIQIGTDGPTSSNPNPSANLTTGTTSTATTDSEAYRVPCVDVSTFQFALDYGWDDSVGQTRSVDLSGTTTPSLFSITFGEPGWSGDENLATCVMAWDIDGMSGDTSGYVANRFTVDPAMAPLVIDTCADGIAVGSICPTFFDSSNGQAVLTVGYTWEVTAEPPVPGIEDQLAPYFAPDTYWNATLSADLFPSVSDSYSFGFTVDAGFTVLATDADIDRFTMQTANGQVDGYYHVANPFVWSFQ